MGKKQFKAHIKVVQSLIRRGASTYPNTDIVFEPLIEAEDKQEVESILAKKYPQFFPESKVYYRDMKDEAQFFYVQIFPLKQHEIAKINQGEWTCSYCGQIHENRYISKPITTSKFHNVIFCGQGDIRDITLKGHSCYELWKEERLREIETPDDLRFIKRDSPNYIYKCTEKSTGKCYIGKTRNAPFFRWWHHLAHSNSPFGKYIRTTKLSDWVFEVLEELPCDISDANLLKIESEYMLKFDSISNGFNSKISNVGVYNV